MMRHGGLREPERLGEMTDACLLARLRLDEAEEPQARGLCEHTQCLRERIGVIDVERPREEGWTRWCESGDRPHQLDIDTRRCPRKTGGHRSRSISTVREVSTVPEVLFVCVHNAGRSQMAAGLVKLRSDGRIHVRSAGSDPGEEINPAVMEAMKELGVDMGDEFPKPLTDEVVRAADVVITMGCGDACPIYPGKRYEDWVLDDPAGQGLDTVRRIRDELDERVQKLISELLV